MPKRTNNRSRFVVLLAVGVLVVGLSVVATLYMSGMFSGISGLTGGGYKYVSLTDATVECQNKARSYLGPRLKSLAFDTHSSRLDETSNRYKIFLIAYLFVDETRTGTSEEYFINCFVRADRPVITTFDLNSAEESIQETTPAANSNNNPFGFPR